MKYTADLHVHTVLSPCGDLDMSPSMIMDQCLIKEINILGIADHNSTRNAEVCYELGRKNGVLVLMGAEVSSKEEVHCLCFMPDLDKLKIFQEYLEKNIRKKKNNPNFFGNQLVVDEKENILDEEELLLIQAIDQSLYQIQEKVEELGGIFIPSHIDAHRNSIGSQLGFIPEDLKMDAIEVVNIDKLDAVSAKYKIPHNAKIIASSDAHYINDIGKRSTQMDLKELSFSSVKNFFNN